VLRERFLVGHLKDDVAPAKSTRNNVDSTAAISHMRVTLRCVAPFTWRVLCDQFQRNEPSCKFMGILLFCPK